jgi:flagellar motility protein MotE (MotC chaperone)
MMLNLRPPRLLPITIFALAGLLAVKSADLVRAAVTATDATPKAATAEPMATPAAPQPSPSPEPPQPAAAKPSEENAAPPVTDGERTVLLELRQRRLELDTREATLAARESLLAAAEQKVSARVVELQALQVKLEALEATRKQREDASWQGLVKLYEAMKPRDAATIFNDLEMPVLLQVVDRMKEAKAAPVLAAMQTDKARELTAKLAEMRTRRDDPGGAAGG